MIKDGLFSDYNIDAVYGLHNLPGLSTGTFAIRPGSIMASESSFPYPTYRQRRSCRDALHDGRHHAFGITNCCRITIYRIQKLERVVKTSRRFL